MPYFEWLGIARIGPPTSGIWVRVLFAVALGWVLVFVVTEIILLIG